MKTSLLTTFLAVCVIPVSQQQLAFKSVRFLFFFFLFHIMAIIKTICYDFHDRLLQPSSAPVLGIHVRGSKCIIIILFYS